MRRERNVVFDRSHSQGEAKRGGNPKVEDVVSTQKCNGRLRVRLEGVANQRREACSWVKLSMVGEKKTDQA